MIIKAGRVLLGIKVVVPAGGLAGAGGQTGDVLVQVLLPGRLVAVAGGADVLQPRLGASPAQIFLLHHLGEITVNKYTRTEDTGC